MASTSETGHAKNVANFQSLIAFVTGYDTTYNPSKVALTLPKLVALHANAETKLANVISRNTAYNNKVNERLDAFSTLKPLATRLVNALQTTDATTETIKDAKTFNRKIQGRRASSAATPVDPNAPAPTTISTSQQSYTQLIQHFAALKAVLESEPTYTPNETELKITALTTKQVSLTTLNNEVATLYANVSNSRLSRNTTLYGTEGSIFDVAAEVKKYIKSVYGALSPEFAQIKGLEFKKPR